MPGAVQGRSNREVGVRGARPPPPLVAPPLHAFIHINACRGGATRGGGVGAALISSATGGMYCLEHPPSETTKFLKQVQCLCVV